MTGEQVAYMKNATIYYYYDFGIKTNTRTIHLNSEATLGSKDRDQKEIFISTEEFDIEDHIIKQEITLDGQSIEGIAVIDKVFTNKS